MENSDTLILFPPTGKILEELKGLDRQKKKKKISENIWRQSLFIEKKAAIFRVIFSNLIEENMDLNILKIC